MNFSLVYLLFQNFWVMWHDSFCKEHTAQIKSFINLETEPRLGWLAAPELSAGTATRVQSVGSNSGSHWRCVRSPSIHSTFMLVQMLFDLACV
jgi:hypothetical protein